MRVAGRGFLLGCALLLGAGCASPPPISEFSLVAPRRGVVKPEILQRGVEGEWCFSQNLIAVTLRPPWQARLADTGRAVAAALEKVEGANVLTDVVTKVRIEQYLLFQRSCAIVFGDAGRIE
ncbi:MAG: hypothetical protein V3U03_09280 [Myxococcota bacterium]